MGQHPPPPLPRDHGAYEQYYELLPEFPPQSLRLVILMQFGGHISQSNGIVFDTGCVVDTVTPPPPSPQQGRCQMAMGEYNLRYS